MGTQSFYQYLLTLQNPNHHDEIAEFAHNAFLDLAFPKNSQDYHEIADYLELNGSYLPSMTIFDEVWQQYLAQQHH